MGIIEPAGENTFPQVPDIKATRCLACGHCEVYCQPQALILNVRPDEKEPLPEGAGNIPAEDMAYYLKKRRSVRQFKQELVPKETITKVLDIARYFGVRGKRATGAVDSSA